MVKSKTMNRCDTCEYYYDCEYADNYNFWQAKLNTEIHKFVRNEKVKQLEKLKAELEM